VRRLISEILSEGIGATVSPRIRDTVVAVNTIIMGTKLEPGKSCATVQGIATVLNVDKSTASRRYVAARKRDYLVNNEKLRGKPAQIVLGDPMPDDLVILPCPALLECCTVAVICGGKRTPPSSPVQNDHYEVLADGQITY